MIISTRCPPIHTRTVPRKTMLRLCMPKFPKFTCHVFDMFLLDFLFKHVGSTSSPFDCVKGWQTTSQSTSFVISHFGAIHSRKDTIVFSPIHETSIFFVDMVMADIAFDGCVGSYWVPGLQALLMNWRDGYNLTISLAICGRQTKTCFSPHFSLHEIPTFFRSNF